MRVHIYSRKRFNSDNYDDESNNNSSDNDSNNNNNNGNNYSNNNDNSKNNNNNNNKDNNESREHSIASIILSYFTIRITRLIYLGCMINFDLNFKFRIKAYFSL